LNHGAPRGKARLVKAGSDGQASAGGTLQAATAFAIETFVTLKKPSLNFFRRLKVRAFA
jgi:hypothetical protein